MLPEVLLRILSHPFLQYLAVTRYHRVDVRLTLTGGSDLDRLEHGPEFTVWQPKQIHEHRRHSESQGEYRKSARGLGRTAEKRNERRCEPKHSLVRKQTDKPSVAKRLHHVLHGACIVHDIDAELRSVRVEIVLEQPVVHSADDHLGSKTFRCEKPSEYFPVPMMRSHSDRRAAPRNRGLDVLPSVNSFDKPENALWSAARYQCGFDGVSP